MVRNRKDYKNGKIYKIWNDVDDELYVGSTTQPLSKRMNVHRAYARGGKNQRIYKHMRGCGIDNFKIELIEYYPCETKEELLKREGHWIRKIGTLNMNRAYTTDEEKKEYQKEYREQNKEKMQEYQKEYQKEYKENNKDKIKEYNKNYNKQKITCKCGGRYTRTHKAEHERSKKHQKYINEKN